MSSKPKARLSTSYNPGSESGERTDSGSGQTCGIVAVTGGGEPHFRMLSPLEMRLARVINRSDAHSLHLKGLREPIGCVMLKFDALRQNLRKMSVDGGLDFSFCAYQD
jgi:hypothetical protein